MKVFYVVILLAFLPLTVWGQPNTRALELDYRKSDFTDSPATRSDFSDSLETYFATIRNNIEYSLFNGRRVKFDYLANELDTCIKHLFEQPLPIWQIGLFGDGYRKDSRYKELIDTIVNLPYSQNAFNQYVDEIEDKIKKLKKPEHRIQAIIHFGKHFHYYNDSNKLSYYYSLATKIAEEQSTSLDSASCYEAIGDASYVYSDLISSFTAYSIALKIYINQGYAIRAGDLESKIAWLLESFRSHPSYQREALYHIQMAKTLYDTGDDTLGSILSELKASLLSFKIFGHSANPDSILKSAYNANQHINFGEASSEYRYHLFKVLGQHFLNKGNDLSLTIAKKYFTGALIESFKDFNDYDIRQVSEAFLGLAYVNARLGDGKEAIKHIDYALSLNDKAGNYFGTFRSHIEKADILYLLGDTLGGISYLKTTLNQLEISPKTPSIYKNEYFIRAYSLLSLMYKQLGQYDSSQVYSNLYYTKINSYTGELSDLTLILNSVYQSKALEVIRGQDKSIVDLQNDKRKQLILIISLSSIIVLLGVAYFVFKRLYRRRLVLELQKLRGLTQRKLHNIKNIFNGFTALVLKNKIDDAVNYADKSAYYLGFTLNKWYVDSDEWTLEKEIKLLFAYYEMEKSINIEVEIIIDVDDIDIKRTRFLPEVFPTLLQNSIRHGFKSKTPPYTFTIVGHRQDDLLYFKVSDNGIPSKKDIYLKEGGTSFGLLIIKKSIETILELYKGKKIARKGFDINTDNGTTVTFIYPYVATT